GRCRSDSAVERSRLFAPYDLRAPERFRSVVGSGEGAELNDPLADAHRSAPCRGEQGLVTSIREGCVTGALPVETSEEETTPCRSMIGKMNEVGTVFTCCGWVNWSGGFGRACPKVFAPTWAPCRH